MTKEEREKIIDNLEYQNEMCFGGHSKTLKMAIKALKEEPKGYCKDCKNFEYNSVAKVYGIPLIVAHEICSRWGDGCKTSEDGYCFLFEPKESEDI